MGAIKVLLVEDVAADAELAQHEVRQALSRAEFLVVETREELEQAIPSFRPDIILSDYQLPRFDGRAALEIALRLAPDTPFIIVTGSTNEDTAVECMKAGAWDYVIKEHSKRLRLAVQGALTERESRRARKQAEAERAKLAMAIEQAAEVIVVTDAAGTIQYVNPAFEAVTGYSRAEALGANPRMLKSGVQDDAFYRELWNTISHGGIWRGKFVNRRKDGSHYVEEATISPVKDPGDMITSYVAVKRDISRDLEVEAHLLQAQRMESIGRLAGGVAHDFNNLLSVIMSYADSAMGRVAEGDPVRQDLDEVKRAATRAGALTRQLLVFGRQQALRLVPLSLNQVVLGVETMLRRILGEDVELVQVLAPDLGVVRADPGQSEQVLMNLVVNARDAMPEGGRLLIQTANTEVESPSAEVDWGVAPGSYVKLSVADSGVGMDRQTMSRIFEPFFTTKAIGKGTGLGLSMVYGIVKQSGGAIVVRSECGRGSVFEVYLPRIAGAAIAPRGEGKPPRQATKGVETVLVVEDDEALRYAARRSLEGKGYTVLLAEDGREAKQVAEQHAGEIHLLLTDLVMPRMGGRALAAELLRSRPQLKILYMSGYADAATLAPDAHDLEGRLLTKPFCGSDLTRKVREVLDADDATSADGALAPAWGQPEPGQDLPLPEVLSPAILTRLRNAVTAARLDEIVDVVAAIRPTHPRIAERLSELVGLFDYEGLWRLLTDSDRGPTGKGRS